MVEQKQAQTSAEAGNRFRFPRLVAAVMAFFVGLQCVGLGLSVMRLLLEMEHHRALILSAGAFTGFLGAGSAYYLIAHLLGATMPRQAVKAGFAYLSIYCIFEFAIIITLITFGKMSPFGYVFEGIRGPFTDGLVTGFVPMTWWPVAFFIGAVTALILTRYVYKWLRREGVFA